mgnify:CR=1 FL=1
MGEKTGPKGPQPLKPWVVRYIEIKSDLDNELTDKEIAKLLDITPVGLCYMRKAHPEVNDQILENIKRQTNTAGVSSMKALKRRIDAGSDKCIQLGLEMSGLYTPKSELTNRYEGQDKAQIINDIKRRLAAARGVQAPDTDPENK